MRRLLLRKTEGDLILQPLKLTPTPPCSLLDSYSYRLFWEWVLVPLLSFADLMCSLLDV